MQNQTNAVLIAEKLILLCRTMQQEAIELKPSASIIQKAINEIATLKVANRR